MGQISPRTGLKWEVDHVYIWRGMLLRSWVRMLVFNEQRDERFFHILDQHWSEVHAAFQLHMMGHSGLLHE